MQEKRDAGKNYCIILAAQAHTDGVPRSPVTTSKALPRHSGDNDHNNTRRYNSCKMKA